MELTKVIFEAIGLSIYHWRALAKALSIPMCLSIVLELVFEHYFSSYSWLIYGLLFLIIETKISVITHRIILLGSEEASLWKFLKWNKRELKFSALAVGMLLSLVLLNIALSLIAPSAIYVGIAIGAFMMCRIFLVFPSIAIDKRITTRESWELTKGNFLFMFRILIVFPTILYAPIYLLDLIPYTSAFSILLSNILLVITIAALSLAYKNIVNKPETIS